MSLAVGVLNLIRYKNKIKGRMRLFTSKRCDTGPRTRDTQCPVSLFYRGVVCDIPAGTLCSR